MVRGSRAARGKDVSQSRKMRQGEMKITVRWIQRNKRGKEHLQFIFPLANS